MGFEKHRIFEQSDQPIFAKLFVCWKNQFCFWFWGSGLIVVLWALFETVQGCQTFNSFSPYGGDRTGTFGWWFLVDREIAAASAHLRPAIKRVMDTISKTTNSKILGEDHGRDCKKCSYNTSIYRYTLNFIYMHVYLTQEQQLRYGVVVYFSPSQTWGWKKRVEIRLIWLEWLESIRMTWWIL